VPDEFRGSVVSHLTGHSGELPIWNEGVEDNLSASHESSAGAFTFSARGEVATHRAVAPLDPGYFEYGDATSATVRLRR
jgi:hypothetical protein